MHDRTRGDLEQKCRREGRHSGNLAGLRTFATCKFRRLRNFATLLPCTPIVDCFLTRFFVVLYKSTLYVILVPLYTFVQIYTFVTSINFQSINHSIKLGAKFPLLRLLCDFLSFSFTFLHFLTIQTPLDDDKSRDAWLRPLILEEESHWIPVLR